jgi:Ras-related protein Rab-7A
MKSFDNLHNWREEFLIQVKYFQRFISSVSLTIHNNPVFFPNSGCFTLQASPSDPDNFPFVLLGNKVDVDGGNSRVVSNTT